MIDKIKQTEYIVLRDLKGTIICTIYSIFYNFRFNRLLPRYTVQIVEEVTTSLRKYMGVYILTSTKRETAISLINA